jgi:hypothetical protein
MLSTPSEENAEESTVTSCCILSKSLFSNNILLNTVLSELLEALLNTKHIYILCGSYCIHSLTPAKYNLKKHSNNAG